MDGDGLYALLEGSQRRHLRCAVGGVSGLAEFVGDELDAEFLARTEFARRGKDLGGIGEDGLLEAVIHNMLILDVVIAEDSDEEQQNGGKHQQSSPQKHQADRTLSLGPWNLIFNAIRAP